MRISDWRSDVCSSYLFCESRIPNSQSRLLNVLHLLADLVDQHLQLHRDVAGARVDGFRAQGVGFAVELLQQEVQAAADRLFLGEDATDLDDVAVEAAELLVAVELLPPQQIGRAYGWVR